MSMVHEHYVLRRSRLAITFQCMLLLGISILLYHAVAISIWFISTGLLLVALYIFQKKPSIEFLQRLDQLEWSCKFKHHDRVERISISRMVDHSLYIVIYCSDQQLNPIVIWRDQLDVPHWKSLKVHARLN